MSLPTPINRRYRRAVARVAACEARLAALSPTMKSLPEWQRRKLAVWELAAARGYAHKMHRSHFARLCARFQWELVTPFTPTF